MLGYRPTFGISLSEPIRLLLFFVLLVVLRLEIQQKSQDFFSTSEPFQRVFLAMGVLHHDLSNSQTRALS